MSPRPLAPPPAPPAAPPRQAKVVINDQLRRIDPQDGDVLVLPADFSPTLMREFHEALLFIKPGIKCMVIRGDLNRLSVSEMNAAGWYRA